MKIKVLILLGVLVLCVSPAWGQNALAEAAIPADFAGFVRVRLDAPTAIPPLNIAVFAAARLQPERISSLQFAGYDTLFPLDIFDVEGATFSQFILPWAKGEVIVAYRQFGQGLRVQRDDVLMIVPAQDMLRAAAALAPVLQAQDFLETESYQGLLLHKGDLATIAFTPEAVLIGSSALVKQALDARAGAAARLIDQAAYQMVIANSPPNTLLFAYLKGENAASALNGLLNTSTTTEPLLVNLGESLREAEFAQGSFGLPLLTSSLDALGASVVVEDLPFVPGTNFVVGENNEPLRVRASITLYNEQTHFNKTEAFDSSVLNLIPQSAFVVQSGSNARSAAYDVLYTLPLTNFAGSLLGAFPVQPSVGVFNNQINQPSAEDLQQAVSGYLSVLNALAGFDLDTDLLNYLSGSYSFALIPRPNNPTPVLNTPFDVLFVAQVNNRELAAAGVTRLLEIIFGSTLIENEDLDGVRYATIREQFTGEVIVRVGVIDNTLIVATGSALQPALQARSGDNRLVDRERWQTVSKDEIPQLFVNISSFYSTFFPTTGGQPAANSALLLAANGDVVENGLYELKVLMTLPVN